MARGGKQPALGDLHDATGRDVYLPCPGRNQPGRMEQAGIGTDYQDPASVVEYVVVSSAMGGCLPSTVLGAVSSAYPANAASGKETSGCHRNHPYICLDRFARWLRGFRKSPLAGIHGFVRREDSWLRLASRRSRRRLEATRGEVARVSGYRRAADEQYRWFLARAVPLRDQRGKILKWYGVSTDIEDRKRVDEALQRSQFYISEGQ